VLEIPTLRILRLQAEQDIETEINGALGSRLRTAIAFALAGLVYLLLKSLQFLSRQIFIDTADEAFALLWASIYGVEANPATSASGPAQFTGANGTVFVGGEIAQREDGTQFAVVTPGVIGPTGEIVLDVEAVEAGAAGNTIAGETLTLTAPPVGADAEAVVVNDGIVDGFDVESVESVVERTLELIRAPRRGGSEEDYEIWAKEVPGIANAYARGSFAGIGTVLVIVAQEWDPALPLSPTNTPIPSASLIGDVEAYLEERKPAGLHLVAVQPPVLQSLDPFIVLDPDSPTIQANVARSLALQLATVDPGTLARYDDQVIAINRAAGEEHHQLWTEDLDNPATYGPYNTQVGDNNLLIPGTITWTAP
jgi:uncharacterized phage protein gp47/JayE